MNTYSNLRILGAALFLFGVITWAPQARATMCPQCGTEFTQILNNIEIAVVAAQEAQILAANIAQYQVMLKNLETLPQQIEQQAIADLKALASIVAQGRAVAYSSGTIAEDYEREHRDFSYYEQLGSKSPENHQEYSTRYKDWSQSNHDSIRGALQAAGLQAQQFHNEEAALKAIEAQLGSAVGQNQILQAGASIASLQVEQLMKLRQLTMSQMQIQAADAASRTERQTEEDVIQQRATTPHSYDKNAKKTYTPDDLLF